MAIDPYILANRMAKKEISDLKAAGKSTEMPVLDEIIENVNIAREVPLGVVDIPMEMLVGTKTRGRAPSFSPGFMPILGMESEFSFKWSELAKIHLDEGIRDPIKAYEYMNRFYVLEGNKRVSVLRYYGAKTIAGNVTRLIPERDDTLENKIYYEYLDFYNATNINYLYLTTENGYKRLCNMTGHHSMERWSVEERIDFRSCYFNFMEALEEMGGMELNKTPGDIFLLYIIIFGYKQVKDNTPSDIKKQLEMMWDEVMLFENGQNIDFEFAPSEEQKKGGISKLFSGGSTDVSKVAFIMDKTAEVSAWSMTHLLGVNHIDSVMGSIVETRIYDDIFDEPQAWEAFSKALSDGNKIIFATSPDFVKQAMKTAIENPDVKVYLCTIDQSHKYIRSYAVRMFEVKYLMGVLAGIMCPDEKIGYVAEFPEKGSISSINAFAMGVASVNPTAKVKVVWSTLMENQGVNLGQYFLDNGIHYISGSDLFSPEADRKKGGLFRLVDGEVEDLARAIVNWGKYYERIINNVKNGVWKDEDKVYGNSSLNYWWGISAGVADFIMSGNVPSPVKQLLSIVEKSLISYEAGPFDPEMIAQDGTVKNPEGRLGVEAILDMDWLLENVEGRIPHISEFVPAARKILKASGVYYEEG